ncbi:MAG: hypothetical protein QOG38_2319 [Hyphomicrobiales bacterium]|nr:hypothetical protein [Hyphomicrobiales bacterium]
MVPNPLRGVDGAEGPLLRGPDVVGAIDVDVGLDVRVLGNQERGDEFLLSYEVYEREEFDQCHEPQLRRRHGCGAAAGSPVRADGAPGTAGVLAGAGWHCGRGGIM